MEAMAAAIAAIVGLAAGLFLGVLWATRLQQARQRDLQDRLVQAEASLLQAQETVRRLTGEAQALQARLEEREKAATEFEARMRETLAALSQEALARNSAEFLRLATEKFQQLSERTEGALATREERFKGLLQPLAEQLKRYDEAMRELERRREQAYSTLEERLRALAEAEQALRTETSRLVTALRRPEVRGRWGEMTLRNVVELLGMSQYCDFVEQYHLSADTRTLRPDMIIRLPGGGIIVVDNKVPMDAFLQALEAADPEERQIHLKRHAEQCRAHIRQLSEKAYWEQFETSPSCVVMFIPIESLYAAALEAAPELPEEALRNRIVIATPATLMALLHAVAYGWRQQTLAENLEEVRRLAGEFYNRLLVFAKHLSDVGKALGNAVKNYNEAVASANSRLYPQAARLKELGVTAKEELPELQAVDTAPLPLRSEMQSGLPAAAETEGD